jgi:hypothetical protein
MAERINDWYYVIASAMTIGELKKILSELGDDENIILFQNHKECLEVVKLEKMKVNKNAGQPLSETPKGIEMIDCVMITMS